jgi:hypothetical protein
VGAPGLPRLVQPFEARKPKDPAVISEIGGIVKDGGVVKGQRKMIIVPDDGGEPREYALPRGVHVNVHEGERPGERNPGGLRLAPRTRTLPALGTPPKWASTSAMKYAQNERGKISWISHICFASTM